MPSVRGGRELTGFCCKNLAVAEELRSEFSTLGPVGARNWKNSYSAADTLNQHGVPNGDKYTFYTSVSSVLKSQRAHLLP